MQLIKKEIKVNKIHRKKFFSSLATGVFGFIFFNSLPLKFFSTKKMKNEQQVTIQINPHAVSRRKSDIKNA
jgi:hypothetical protein